MPVPMKPNNNNSNHNNTKANVPNDFRNIYNPAAHTKEIQYRDIRRLEYTFNPHEEPYVIIRRHVVVFNFTPLRAVSRRL